MLRPLKPSMAPLVLRLESKLLCIPLVFPFPCLPLANSPSCTSYSARIKLLRILQLLTWFQTSTLRLTLLSAWNAFQQRPHTFTHLSSLNSQTDLSLKLFVITMPLLQIELTFSFFLFPLLPGQTISTAPLSQWSHLSGTMPAWLFPQHKHNSLTSTYYPPWVSTVVKCCRSGKSK